MNNYWNNDPVKKLLCAAREIGFSTPNAWPTNKKLVELEHPVHGTVYVHSQGRTNAIGTPSNISLSLHPQKPTPSELPRGCTPMTNPRMGTGYFSHSGMRRFRALVGREPTSRSVKCDDFAALIAMLRQLAAPSRQDSRTMLAGAA